MIDVGGGASTTTTDGFRDDAIGAGAIGGDIAGIGECDVARTAAYTTGCTEAEGVLAAADVATTTSDGEGKDTDTVVTTGDDVSTSVVGNGDVAGVTAGAPGSAERCTHGSSAGEGATTTTDRLGIDAVGSIAADIDDPGVGDGDVAGITTVAAGTTKADRGISACAGAWGGDADTTATAANRLGEDTMGLAPLGDDDALVRDGDTAGTAAATGGATDLKGAADGVAFCG